MSSLLFEINIILVFIKKLFKPESIILNQFKTFGTVIVAINILLSVIASKRIIAFSKKPISICNINGSQSNKKYYKKNK